MKFAANFLSIIIVLLILGASSVNAQSMGPTECAMVKDCRMCGEPGMMEDMHDRMGMGGMMRGGMGVMPDDLIEVRHHVMELMMGLDLDDKQMGAIQKIIDTTVKDMIKKRSDLLIATIDFEGILHQDPVNVEGAEAQMKQIDAMKTDMFISHLKALEKIKSELSAEQKSRLKQMIQMQIMGGMEMMICCDCNMQDDKKANE